MFILSDVIWNVFRASVCGSIEISQFPLNVARSLSRKVDFISDSGKIDQTVTCDEQGHFSASVPIGTATVVKVRDTFFLSVQYEQCRNCVLLSAPTEF